MQHAEQLQAVMKSKFSSSNDSGIKIGFKLPDGSKTEYVFKENSTVKVYQLPFNTMCVDNLSMWT